VVATSGILGSFYAVPGQFQDTTALGQQWEPLVAGPGKLGTLQLVAPQAYVDSTATVWSSVTAGPGILGARHAVAEQPQDRPTVAQYTLPTFPLTPPAQPLRTIVAGPQVVDLTLPAVSTKPLIGSLPGIGAYQNAAPQQDFTLAAQWSRPVPAVLTITGPTVSPYVTPGQVDANVNYSLTLTPATFSPSAPIVVTPPAVGGGSVPGKVGGGLGPYKRPGQVFGEQDPLSPFLSSAPPAVLDAKAADVPPIVAPVRNDDDLLAFLILEAMDGPLH
jgi:hypothetical protein